MISNAHFDIIIPKTGGNLLVAIFSKIHANLHLEYGKTTAKAASLSGELPLWVSQWGKQQRTNNNSPSGTETNGNRKSANLGSRIPADILLQAECAKLKARY